MSNLLSHTLAIEGTTCKFDQFMELSIIFFLATSYRMDMNFRLKWCALLSHLI
jgi:hypothetical protein